MDAKRFRQRAARLREIARFFTDEERIARLGQTADAYDQKAAALDAGAEVADDDEDDY